MQPFEVDDKMDDLVLDDFLANHPEYFMPERLQWLATSSSLLSTYTFVRILQHWAVTEDIPQNKLTRLLSLLHTFHPTLTIRDYEFLPKTGRTLLKIPNARKKQFPPPQIKKMTATKLFRGKKIEKYIGNYLHLGLEHAITGISCGLTHRFHYKNLLRRIHTVYPLLLPDQFLKLTRPEADEPFDMQTFNNWLFKKEEFRTVEPLVFEVRINVDGVQWFISSKVSGIPILAKIVAIRTMSGKTRVKIPYHICKPFIIGIYEQKSEKPRAGVLMEDTIEEMKRLHPDSLMPGEAREHESFAVQVTCFCCDDPMRRDLKGIKFSGSFSCERCQVEGKYLDCNGKEVKTKAKEAATKKAIDMAAKALVKKAKADEKKQQAIKNGKARRQAKKKGGAPLLGHAKKSPKKRRSKIPPPSRSKAAAVVRGVSAAPMPRTILTIVAERETGKVKAPLNVLRVSNRGSTYFPETDCEPRTDENWHEYRIPGIKGQVSTDCTPRIIFWFGIFVCIYSKFLTHIILLSDFV
jgi:hypothetical protein